MEKPILYSLPTCGRCKILEEKMRKKNIAFEKINDIEILNREQIDMVPILKIKDKRMGYVEANSWINEQ